MISVLLSVIHVIVKKNTKISNFKSRIFASGYVIFLMLYSHSETEIVDTRVSSRIDTGTLCNWETQIACHTHTVETEVTESPSCPVQWTSRNEFSSEFPKMYQSTSLRQVIQVALTTWLFLTREKQEDFSYTSTIEKNLNCRLLQPKNCRIVIQNSLHSTEWRRIHSIN